MKITPETNTGGRVYKHALGPVPSVTTVLSIVEGNHFQAWRAKVGDQEADRISGNAKAFGTHVHTIAEKIANDKDWRIPADMDPSYRPYAKAVRDFLLGHVRRVIATEVSMASRRQGFGGQMDMYCELHDGAKAIVDWKTTRQLSKTVGRQLAGYGLLCLEKGWPVDKRIGVRICKDKPGEFRARSYADHKGDVRVIRAAVELWWALDAQKRDPLPAWTPGELVA